MSEVVVRVEGLSKEYYIGGQQARYKTIRESISETAKRPFRDLFSSGMSTTRTKNKIWALKDISFEVKRGDIIGVIGRNGAGKTTLLKILSRITKPTTGFVDLYGRVGSLLEVGTGFHPELTGRENIFLNGAILGMKRVEIENKFTEIVEFSGIEKFLDTPVKRYSSGMYVRLAFSVAAHLDPDILLVDEVLAVGDLEFQRRCLGKMEEVVGTGRTVIIVSHNMALIENLCERVILLEQGAISSEGVTSSVINHYLTMVLPSAIDSINLADRTDRSGNGRVKLASFHIENSQSQTISVTSSGQDTYFVLGFTCTDGEKAKGVDVGISLHQGNQALSVLYSSYTGTTFSSLPPEGQFRCLIPDFPLSAGRYRVGARVTVGGEESDWPRDGIGYIDVETGDFYETGRSGFGGSAPLLINGNWEVTEKGSTSV